jgi:hypothetical protein
MEIKDAVSIAIVAMVLVLFVWVTWFRDKDDEPPEDVVVRDVSDERFDINGRYEFQYGSVIDLDGGKRLTPKDDGSYSWEEWAVGNIVTQSAFKVLAVPMEVGEVFILVHETKVAIMGDDGTLEMVEFDEDVDSFPTITQLQHEVPLQLKIEDDTYYYPRYLRKTSIGPMYTLVDPQRGGALRPTANGVDIETAVPFGTVQGYLFQVNSIEWCFTRDTYAVTLVDDEDEYEEPTADSGTILTGRVQDMFVSGNRLMIGVDTSGQGSALVYEVIGKPTDIPETLFDLADGIREKLIELFPGDKETINRLYQEMVDV